MTDPTCYICVETIDRNYAFMRCCKKNVACYHPRCLNDWQRVSKHCPHCNGTGAARRDCIRVIPPETQQRQPRDVEILVFDSQNDMDIIVLD